MRRMKIKMTPNLGGGGAIKNAPVRSSANPAAKISNSSLSSTSNNSNTTSNSNDTLSSTSNSNNTLDSSPFLTMDSTASNTNSSISTQSTSSQSITSLDCAASNASISKNSTFLTSTLDSTSSNTNSSITSLDCTASNTNISNSTFLTSSLDTVSNRSTTFLTSSLDNTNSNTNIQSNSTFPSPSLTSLDCTTSNKSTFLTTSLESTVSKSSPSIASLDSTSSNSTFLTSSLESTVSNTNISKSSTSIASLDSTSLTNCSLDSTTYDINTSFPTPHIPSKPSTSNPTNTTSKTISRNKTWKRNQPKGPGSTLSTVIEENPRNILDEEHTTSTSVSRLDTSPEIPTISSIVTSPEISTETPSISNTSRETSETPSLSSTGISPNETSSTESSETLSVSNTSPETCETPSLSSISPNETPSLCSTIISETSRSTETTGTDISNETTRVKSDSKPSVSARRRKARFMPSVGGKKDSSGIEKQGGTKKAVGDENKKKGIGDEESKKGIEVNSEINTKEMKGRMEEEGNKKMEEKDINKKNTLQKQEDMKRKKGIVEENRTGSKNTLENVEKLSSSGLRLEVERESDPQKVTGILEKQNDTQNSTTENLGAKNDTLKVMGTLERKKDTQNDIQKRESETASDNDGEKESMTLEKEQENKTIEPPSSAFKRRSKIRAMPSIMKKKVVKKEIESNTGKNMDSVKESERNNLYDSIKLGSLGPMREREGEGNRLNDKVRKEVIERNDKIGDREIGEKEKEGETRLSHKEREDRDSGCLDNIQELWKDMQEIEKNKMNETMRESEHSTGKTRNENKRPPVHKNKDPSIILDDSTPLNISGTSQKTLQDTGTNLKSPNDTPTNVKSVLRSRENTGLETIEDIPLQKHLKLDLNNENKDSSTENRVLESGASPKVAKRSAEFAATDFENVEDYPLPKSAKNELKKKINTGAEVLESSKENEKIRQKKKPKLSHETIPKKPLSKLRKTATVKTETKLSEGEDEKTEKQIFRERKEEYRKKLSKGGLEPGRMTMFDLIFWNPANNPMPGRPDIDKKKLRLGSKCETESQASDIIEEHRVEEAGLDIEDQVSVCRSPSPEIQIEEASHSSPKEINDSGQTTSPGSSPIDSSQIDPESENKLNKVEENKQEEAEVEDVFAPRVKIGPNGQIIIDEQSIKIQTTAARNRDEILSKAEVVEEHNDSVHYGKWSKRRKRSSEWTIKETARFYKALSTVGTDFSMMEALITWRSRAELKTKFKKEERANRELVDKALRDSTQFDVSLFDEESDYDPEEDRKATRLAEREEAKQRRMLMKQEAKEQEKMQKKLNQSNEKSRMKKRKKVLRRARTVMSVKNAIKHEESKKDSKTKGKKIKGIKVKKHKPERRNSFIISEVTVTMEYTRPNERLEPAHQVEEIIEQTVEENCDIAVGDPLRDNATPSPLPFEAGDVGDVCEIEGETAIYSVNQEGIEENIQDNIVCEIDAEETDLYSINHRSTGINENIREHMDTNTYSNHGNIDSLSTYSDPLTEKYSIPDTQNIAIDLGHSSKSSVIREPQEINVNLDHSSRPSVNPSVSEPQKIALDLAHSSQSSVQEQQIVMDLDCSSQSSVQDICVEANDLSDFGEMPCGEIFQDHSQHITGDMMRERGEGKDERDEKIDRVGEKEREKGGEDERIDWVEEKERVGEDERDNEKDWEEEGKRGGIDLAEERERGKGEDEMDDKIDWEEERERGEEGRIEGSQPSSSQDDIEMETDENGSQRMWHFPVSAIQTQDDGQQVIVVPTASGHYSVPVPHLPPGTSNVVVMATPVPESPGEHIYHVYVVSPMEEEDQ